MITMMRRNLEIYFKERATVFYSLIGTLMILALYVLFLGNLWSSMNANVPNASHLVDSWVMAGILSVVSVTSTSGALGIMVNDKSSKIYKDFYSSPVKKSQLTGGYILSAAAVGLLMSFIMLVLAEGYIVLMGGKLLSLGSFLEVIALLVLVSLSNTSVMVFFASFFRNHNAYTSSAGIIGSLIGFIAGAYIPIGMFSPVVQWILEPIPLFQASSLMRQVMMRDLLKQAFAKMSQKDLDKLYYMFGIKTRIGSFTIPTEISIVIITVTLIVCFTLSMWNLSKKEQ